MLATSRPYDAFYHRSAQAMNLSPHDHMLSESYGASHYSNKKDTPELEPKAGGPPRKRVPVACERCRKRKIKCSGDQGDGSGCDSCKSAGWDGCQFFRVRSYDPHPTISSSRSWNQHQHHYHPYSASSRTRHVPFVSHHNAYAQPQNSATYSSWPSNFDYTGLATSHTPPLPWSQHNYPTNYSLYDNDTTSPYSTQPPSYMLPDPDHGSRANIACMNTMSRPQQNALWLEHVNSGSIPQQTATMYPLTPAESTKSYAMLGVQPGQHTLSHERTLPQPSLANTLVSLPSNGQDTPPMSAVSHRSSHTWNTDNCSHIGSASSRTSCEGSQDLSAMAQSLTTCEDQATVYPYPAESTSPELDVSATALPIATEASQQQPLQQVTSAASEAGALVLHTPTCRDSMITSSPATAFYGYHNGRSSSHRNHNMATTRLLTGGYATAWDQTPISSRNTSLSSQQATDMTQYSDHRGSATSLHAAAAY